MNMVSERARHSSLQKRRTGLKKKASELGVYCGLDLCVISYGPRDDDRLETWPEDPSAVKSVIARFSEARRAGKVKQMVGIGLQDFLTQEKVFGPSGCSWPPELDECEEEELRALVKKLDDKLLTLRGRIEQLESPKTSKCSQATPGDNGDLQLH